MRCPAYYMAGRVAVAGGSAWVYHFSRVRPGEAAARMGAYHGTEIAYVFDQHEYWQPVDQVDPELTRQVMGYWLRFARAGDPNGPGAPVWPVYGVDSPGVLELGDSIRSVAPPDADLCRWLGPEAGS